VTGGVGGVVGVGVDLCEVDRMRRTLARTPGFADRVYTEAEQDYCRRRRDPAERFAARFAAKEAVLKALGAGIGSCSLRDIEVVRAESGAPSLVLHGRAAALAADRGVTAWHLSLTHTATLAEAIAIATTAASTTATGPP
jgi:holo-[acyl-carrier protein] synthase